jgi:catechol 2,3-dioxygenase-like lactoylglutathione lyase family enzyme
MATPSVVERTATVDNSWQRPRIAREMAEFDATNHEWAVLAPELNVSDLGRSLSFWCDLLGFQRLYDRPMEGFAYLQRERAAVMLEQVGPHSWLTGELVAPFGRGVNLQIMTASLEPILRSLAEATWPLFRAPEERWYRTGHTESGQRQFLVQDPDGYLLRFAETLGDRNPVT